MVKSEKGIIKRLTEKLYGGLKMNWLTVILFAAGTAVLTAVFLIVPIFENTSFERMGVTFEAWIFFAIIIMANCKTPLDSAVKTFVFFLISQPLIYLLQVPFSSMGWGLFGYYRIWFIWTIATFPMAFVGWYIKRKNWISLLILAPILFSLTNDYIGGFQHAWKHFPYMIVMAVFCLGQVLIYLYTFTENVWQKFLGFVIPLAAIIIMLLVRPSVDISGTEFLPDNPILTESATVVVEDGENISISIESTGQDSVIRVQAKKLGSTGFVIQDGDNEYRYTVEIYEDDAGYNQIRITPENGQ